VEYSLDDVGAAAIKIHSSYQCCGSELIFFGSGSGFALNFGSRLGSVLFLKKIHYKCRSSKHFKKSLKKKKIYHTFMDPDCLENSFVLQII
jgi:hypothetical protein